jgi:hypothetical protein
LVIINLANLQQKRNVWFPCAFCVTDVQANIEYSKLYPGSAAVDFELACTVVYID